MSVKLQALVFMAALLPACSSFYNPFGDANHTQLRIPQNATAYLCDGGKQFYVRMLNNGNDAWLIYPDHEVNLSRAAEGNNRFVSGIISLVIGAETTLNDGEKIAYTGCHAQLKK